jgi:hypothetical protein
MLDNSQHLTEEITQLISICMMFFSVLCLASCSRDSVRTLREERTVLENSTVCTKSMPKNLVGR